MTAAATIIENARDLGVRLEIEGGKLVAEGPPPAVEQLLPTLREHKPALLRALADPAPNLDESCGHWLIIQPAERIEHWFTPSISRVELAQRYPGAIFVALPSGAESAERHQDLTPENMTELDRLVQLVAGTYQSPPEEIQEMREAAARHPGSGLSSFRAMARELGLCDVQESPGPSKGGMGEIPNP